MRTPILRLPRGISIWQEGGRAAATGDGQELEEIRQTVVRANIAKCFKFVRRQATSDVPMLNCSGKYKLRAGSLASSSPCPSGGQNDGCCRQVPRISVKRKDSGPVHQTSRLLLFLVPAPEAAKADAE